MNITAAPQATQDLCAADDFSFRAFSDTVHDHALIMLNPQGQVISWNPGAGLIAGYRSEEIIGRPFSLFYMAEDVESAIPERELALAAREGRYQEEGWRVRKDGSNFWASAVLTPLRSADQLVGYVCAIRDLSDRRRYEDHLRFSEARFRALVEGVRDYAIFMLDVDGDVASWKRARNDLGHEATR